MIFYISDLHLGHQNILKLSNRPFETVEEMNEKLITNWNTRIKKTDDVYFLGDFAFKCDQIQATEFLKRLNGRKFFIKGNHDKTTWLESIKQQGLIEWYKDYAEINDAGRMVILCHYPIHSWNGLYHESYHLYGHVHEKTVENADWQKNRFNVSVENTNYYPIALDELLLNSVYTDNHYCIIK